MTDSPDQTTAHPALRMFVLTVTALSTGTAAALLAIGLVELVYFLNIALLVAPRARVQ